MENGILNLKEKLKALKVKKIYAGDYEITSGKITVIITSINKNEWETSFDDNLMEERIQDFRHGVFHYETKREAIYYAKCNIIEYNENPK